MTISKACHDKIVSFEVSSEAVYNKLDSHPVWPGGASGITIGIGYDLGYKTVAQVQHDWASLLSSDVVRSLCAVVGLKGDGAHVALHNVALLSVPFDAALHVFDGLNIPETITQTANAFPHCDTLSVDSFGALVSLVFNRGPDVTSPGDTRKEMRNIRQHMSDMRFDLVPDEIRAMRRLWAGKSGMAGLIARRDWEADTFEAGLASAPWTAEKDTSMDPGPVPVDVQLPDTSSSTDPQQVADQLMDDADMRRRIAAEQAAPTTT